MFWYSVLSKHFGRCLKRTAVRYPALLITKHGYHVGPVPCVLHVYAHAHTFISPVACSLSSWCVILWFEAIYIHSCVVCDCRYLCFFLFVCVFVFFSACLLSGAPGGAKAGFPTEAVDCLLFCFYRCNSWLSGFSFFFCFFFFSLPLSLSPGPVRHYYMFNIVTKINK